MLGGLEEELTQVPGGRLDSSSVVHVVCVLGGGGGLYVQTAGAHG